MFRRLVLIVPLALGCAAESPRATPPRADAPPTVSDPIVVDSRTVILDEAQASRLGPAVGAEGAWMPAPKDVLLVENALPGWLASGDERARGLAGNLDAYGRQWVGVVVGGKRALYGNFFWLESHREAPWRRTAVCVDDGGSHYFQVLFFVEPRRFDSLRVNGGA